MDPILVDGAKNVTDIAMLVNNKSPNKLAVLMFTASWCNPCKIIKKEIYGSYSGDRYTLTPTGLATVLSEKTQFYIIDVDKNPELLQDKNFNVQSAPIFFFAKLTTEGDNKILQINKTTVRGANKNELVEMIKKCA